eukprot:972703-Pleurochrysis_carterae.AAC.1
MSFPFTLILKKTKGRSKYIVCADDNDAEPVGAAEADDAVNVDVANDDGDEDSKDDDSEKEVAGADHSGRSRRGRQSG